MANPYVINITAIVGIKKDFERQICRHFHTAVYFYYGKTAYFPPFLREHFYRLLLFFLCRVFIYLFCFFTKPAAKSPLITTENNSNKVYLLPSWTLKVISFRIVQNPLKSEKKNHYYLKIYFQHTEKYICNCVQI